MNFGITLVYEGTLGRMAEALRPNTLQAIQQAVEKAQPRIEQEVMTLVNTEPPASKGVAPFWTSEKQRRAYFASDGFGAGIPYKRSGEMAKAWRSFVTLTRSTINVGIENTSPAAKYVYGTGLSIQPQQFFHFLTGWATLYNQRDTLIAGIAGVVTPAIQQEIPVVIGEAKYT